MMITKHILIDGHRTTIALEPVYWSVITNLVNAAKLKNINAWITDCMNSKPETETRASWIRQRVLSECLELLRLTEGFKVAKIAVM